MRLFALSLCVVSSLAFAQQWVSPMDDNRTREGGEGTSPVLRDVTVIENLGSTVPMDLPFTDHTGKAVTLKEYFKVSQRPVVLTPVYYACPTLCNTVLQGIVGSLKSTGLKLGDDYDIVTYSIDPNETPAQAYEKRLKLIHDLGYLSSLKEWPYLVGPESSVRALSEAVGFRYKYDQDIKQYAHSAVFMVLTPDGKISRYVYGVRFPPRDVKLALVEASAGKVGTAFDRFLLTCYKFDPASRRYEIYIKGFIRTGGVLVLIALSTLLAIFWRREVKFGHGAKRPSPVSAAAVQHPEQPGPLS